MIGEKNEQFRPNGHLDLEQVTLKIFDFLLLSGKLHPTSPEVSNQNHVNSLPQETDVSNVDLC